ncbi:MAG: LOG family protein [Planctomycetota bacterium]
MPHVITIFGSGTCDPSDPSYRLAFQLGRAIAEAGWTLCNGGYAGTMEAACRGAVEAGGHTIGVTCRIPPWTEAPNRWVRQEIPTFDLLSRLNTLVRLSDGFVALPGGTGTLLELALVWELLNKGLLPRPVPFVLLGAHWRPVVEMVRRAQPSAPELNIAQDVPAAINLLRGGLDSSDPAAPGPPADFRDPGW